jgi:tRNA(Ile)-lysidine synthase
MLTGGPDVRDGDRPTLLAVSGGADSSALALALGRRPGVLAIGHVVHDMRSKKDAEADREVVEELGERLGLPVRIERVRLGKGNAEASARQLRYEALAGLADDAGCRYVATAHQADDVLETLLANLVRGTGPRGLRGPAHRRAISAGVTLVRPMLRVTRAQAEAICRKAHWRWVEDETNVDPGGADAPLRAALRERVLPELEALRPGAALRAARGAEAVGEAVRVVEGVVGGAWASMAVEREDAVELEREAFGACPAAVREGLLRRVIRHFGDAGHDRLSASTARSLLVWIDAGQGSRVVAGVRFEIAGAVLRATRA